VVEKDCGERRWGETVVSVVSVCVLYGWFFWCMATWQKRKRVRRTFHVYVVHQNRHTSCLTNATVDVVDIFRVAPHRATPDHVLPPCVCVCVCPLQVATKRRRLSVGSAALRASRVS
jgi:hypothetical protein